MIELFAANSAQEAKERRLLQSLMQFRKLAFCRIMPIAPFDMRTLQNIGHAQTKQEPWVPVSSLFSGIPVSRAAVSRSLRHLEDQKLITRKQDPKDRRSALASLTGSGREMLKQVRLTRRRFTEDVFSKLTEEEVEEIAVKLDHLYGLAADAIDRIDPGEDQRRRSAAAPPPDLFVDGESGCACTGDSRQGGKKHK